MTWHAARMMSEVSEVFNKSSFFHVFVLFLPAVVALPAPVALLLRVPVPVAFVAFVGAAAVLSQIFKVPLVVVSGCSLGPCLRFFSPIAGVVITLFAPRTDGRIRVWIPRGRLHMFHAPGTRCTTTRSEQNSKQETRHLARYRELPCLQSRPRASGRPLFLCVSS